jgi:hypothetical protein
LVFAIPPESAILIAKVIPFCDGFAQSTFDEDEDRLRASLCSTEGSIFN